MRTKRPLVARAGVCEVPTSEVVKRPCQALKPAHQAAHLVRTKAVSSLSCAADGEGNAELGNNAAAYTASSPFPPFYATVPVW